MDFQIEKLIKKSVYSDAVEIANADIPWDRLDGKSILLTGAGGFIGYYMTCGLLTHNDLFGTDIKVMALVRNRERAEKKYGDILKRNDIELCVQDVSEPLKCGRADYVIHAASQASNIQFEQDPVGTINANLLGTANVLNFARESQSIASLIVSSLKVYGTVYSDRNYLIEDDIGYIDHTSYKNCYAIGKRASETLAASYAKQYGMDIKIVRPSYIYGASSLTDDRVWAQFIANVVKRENILLKSNGATNRSFCYVTDTVTAMLKVLLDGQNIYPYNISNKLSDTTIRNFAKTACEVFPERNLSLSFFYPEHAAEPVYPDNAPAPEIMDNTRLCALGWEAKVDLKEGIRRAVAILEEE